MGRLLARTIPVLVSLLALAGGARADPAAEARFHDALARQHYAAGRFDAALREFFLEQRISPNPRISFNIALCFQRLGRGDDAYLFFDEYLASDDADAERRRYAEQSLEALKQMTARVLVRTEPRGARIYVDRKEHGSYGSTPKTIPVEPGAHDVSVELDGYGPAAAKVTAARGEEATLELRLVRITGKLRVQSEIAGSVSVRTVAGETVATGRTPLDVELPPGAYEVAVQAPGRAPWRELARVEADAGSTVSASPAPAPAPTGHVTITSNVPGALVEVDRQPVGFTPAVLSDLVAGDHRVRIRAAALTPWEGTVAVVPAERSWLTVSLEDPPSKRVAPATWVAGGVGAVGLVTGAVFGLLARDAHREFESADPASDRRALRERGVTLNAVADVALLTGAVGACAAVVLYFTTSETRGRPSSASVTRSRD